MTDPREVLPATGPARAPKRARRAEEEEGEALTSLADRDPREKGKVPPIERLWTPETPTGPGATSYPRVVAGQACARTTPTSKTDDRPLVLGIDGGTESLRCGVFDLNGTPLAFHAAPYPTTYPAPAHAEQDPEHWWSALGVAVKGALAAAHVRPEQIKGLACDTTC